MAKVVVIDFRLGNLFSVLKACEFCNITAKISSDPLDIEKADAIIIPGVGAFREAMSNLQELNLVYPIKDFAKSGRPILGICIGLQLLLSSSNEFGFTSGLDLIPGKVENLEFDRENESNRLKIPFIGWNKINFEKKSFLFSGIKNCSFFYFVHSFHGVLNNQKHQSSFSTYGNLKITSSIECENIFATQFHPEKSGIQGLKIYQNWARKYNLSEDQRANI
jgi:glutamine amidotransferase